NLFATDVAFGAFRSGGTLFVARRPDTVRFTMPRLSPLPATGPQFVSLGDASAQRDTDATIIGRATPAGTYKWMFVPGTIVQETGSNGDNIRVRLDRGLEAWIDSTNVRSLPLGYPSPRRTVGAMSLVPSAEWVDVVLPVL